MIYHEIILTISDCTVQKENEFLYPKIGSMKFKITALIYKHWKHISYSVQNYTDRNENQYETPS